MGLQLGMSVSDVSLIRHLFRSLIRHVCLRWDMSVSDRSSMKHVEVSDEVCRGLDGLLFRHEGFRSCILVSDGTLKEVSYINNMFVNSKFSCIFFQLTHGILVAYRPFSIRRMTPDVCLELTPIPAVQDTVDQGRSVHLPV